MTVNELIKKLEQANPHTNVFLDTPYFCGHLENVYISDEEIILSGENHL